jgi:nitrite reductase (NADH) small subunit/3-phenylpropionate/trans-cinnamate dioxygenase ferredoxin subunit
VGTIHTVAKVGDVPADGGLVVAVGKRTIALFRTAGGIYAIDDMCPHMGASLASGCLEGNVVTCPWHAWRFRVTDGTWADNPRVKIGSYPVTVEGDEVRVEVPDPPAQATP